MCQNFGAEGVSFWYLLSKFRVRPSRGSVAGRGVLNDNEKVTLGVDPKVTKK